MEGSRAARRAHGGMRADGGFRPIGAGRGGAPRSGAEVADAAAARPPVPRRWEAKGRSRRAGAGWSPVPVPGGWPAPAVPGEARAGGGTETLHSPADSSRGVGGRSEQGRRGTALPGSEPRGRRTPPMQVPGWWNPWSPARSAAGHAFSSGSRPALAVVACADSGPAGAASAGSFGLDRRAAVLGCRPCVGRDRPGRPRSRTSGSSPRCPTTRRGRGPPCWSGRAHVPARRRVSSSARAPTVLLVRSGANRVTGPTHHPRTHGHRPRRTARRSPPAGARRSVRAGGTTPPRRAAPCPTPGRRSACSRRRTASPGTTTHPAPARDRRLARALVRCHHGSTSRLGAAVASGSLDAGAEGATAASARSNPGRRRRFVGASAPRLVVRPATTAGSSATAVTASSEVDRQPQVHRPPLAAVSPGFCHGLFA